MRYVRTTFLENDSEIFVKMIDPYRENISKGLINSLGFALSAEGFSFTWIVFFKTNLQVNRPNIHLLNGVFHASRNKEF